MFSNLLVVLLCHLSKLRSFLWHGKRLLNLTTTDGLERSEAFLRREGAQTFLPSANDAQNLCFCGTSRVILHTLFIELQISFQMNTLLI